MLRDIRQAAHDEILSPLREGGTFACATGQIAVIWLSLRLVRDFGAGLTTRSLAGRAHNVVVCLRSGAGSRP